ncbi:metallo-beta-lactamase protein [Dentipellis sp. KUC8613]|nr:metallo-beta-lactamase protein [Dentipellis sp. KUC8613]
MAATSPSPSNITPAHEYGHEPRPTLTPVEHLTVTFLVDNTIEWFTPLPAGFAHELRTHLHELVPELDPETGVPVLDFERYCCGAHGFSALIQTQTTPTARTHTTLFDTGPDSQSLPRNLRALAVPPGAIERVVLSHWHSDHSGGLLALLAARAADGETARDLEPSPCIVDVHPSRPHARGIAPPPYTTPICRLKADPTFAQIAAAGARVEAHAEPHVVAGGGVYVSGEIPRVTSWEGGLPGAVRWVVEGGGGEGGEGKGRWVPEEHIMDERYVAVDVVGKGLVIFSACSHAGIVNVVRHAVATFQRHIHMIIGGLHLASADLAPRIAPTVHFLARTLRPAPDFVLPMHCTGFNAKLALAAELGEGVVPAGVGHKIRVVGSRENERLMRPPTLFG